MIRFAALGLVLALTACATEPRVAGFRDPSAQISSAALWDPKRMQGDWVSVAAYRGSDWQPGTRVSFDWSTPDGRMVFDTTAGPRVLPVTPAGPGRFRRSDGGEAPPFWVLWVDESYRTAVIGTPGGAFGFVLNRDAMIPADRLEAARQVLDFNGYDLAQLQVLK